MGFVLLICSCQQTVFDQVSVSGQRSSESPSETKPAPIAWPDPLPGFLADVPALQRAVLAGSWTLTSPQSFDEEWIDEQGLTDVRSKDVAGRRLWKGVGASTPTLPLDVLVNDRPGPVAAYLFSILTMPDLGDRAVVLHIRHRGRLRVRLDGVLLLDAAAPESGTWSEHRLPVVVHGSHAALLLKLGRGPPHFGDSLEVEVRASAPDGSAIDRQTWMPVRVSQG